MKCKPVYKHKVKLAYKYESKDTQIIFKLWKKHSYNIKENTGTIFKNSFPL